MNTIRTSKLVLTKDTCTTCVTLTSVYPFEELKSNQEEADTKVILHCLNVLQEDVNRSVILRSHSGDTDITVLAVSLLHTHRNRVYLENGTGKNKKGHWLNSVKLTDSNRNAIIGFLAFTGNDYVSSFFRKGKKLCWKTMVQKEKFVQMFGELGSSWNLEEDQFNILEEFTAHIYGSKESDINCAGSSMFRKKFQAENKTPDISVLPPCQSVLKLHIRRANFVACLWKKSSEPIIDVQPVYEHGWYEDNSVQWIDKPFPESVEDIMFDEAFEEDTDIDSDVESEEEDF